MNIQVVGGNFSEEDLILIPRTTKVSIIFHACRQSRHSMVWPIPPFLIDSIRVGYFPIFGMLYFDTVIIDKKLVCGTLP